MAAQPYTKADLDRGTQIVRALHGLKGFDAWAEHIAKAIASERQRCHDIALAIDSGRGNEKEIARAILNSPAPSTGAPV